MRHYILLMLTLLVSQPLCAQIDTTISAPGPTSSRNDEGASHVPPAVRPEHTSSSLPLSHSADFEDFCGPAGIYGCNFMKPDAESRWLMDAKISAHAELDLKNRELAAKASGLDRDLAALRAGSDMNGSGFGASIQAKLDATKAARQRTEVLQASRGKIFADASHANHLAVDNALDAARSNIPKSDHATSAKSIDQTVGKYYLSERIEVEFRRADSIESRIKTEGGQYQADRLLIATDGRNALDLAQRNLDLGLLERSHMALRLGARLLDVALDFSPLIVAAAAPQATLAIGVAMTVAFAKDYYEARTGHRLISGEVLAAADRAIALTAVVLDVVPLVGPSFRALASASDCLEIFTDMMKSAKAEGRVASASAAEVAALSEAVQGTERVLDSAKNAKPILTPYGEAVQELSKEAIVARNQVAEGQRLYKLGKTGSSNTGGQSQYWSLEHPSTPGYGSRHGIPTVHVDEANFMETAVIRPVTPFVTRRAPPSPDGINPGGGIEVVVPENGVVIQSHNHFGNGGQ